MQSLQMFPTPVLVMVSVATEREWGNSAADWYTGGSSSGNLPIWAGATIQPETDTIWMETNELQQSMHLTVSSLVS